MGKRLNFGFKIHMMWSFLRPKTQRIVLREKKIFLDVTAAYDTVWHLSLVSELLSQVSDRHMISMINCHEIYLHPQNKWQNRFRHLKNGSS